MTQVSDIPCAVPVTLPSSFVKLAPQPLTSLARFVGHSAFIPQVEMQLRCLEWSAMHLINASRQYSDGDVYASRWITPDLPRKKRRDARDTQCPLDFCFPSFTFIALLFTHSSDSEHLSHPQRRRSESKTSTIPPPPPSPARTCLSA